MISLPLAVDLDGTLVFTDLTYEAIVQFVKPNPFRIILLLLWILRGRAYFKNKLAQHLVTGDVGSLPYNLPLIEYLREEKKKGRRIVLATASNQRIADALAAPFDFFEAAYGSSPKVNLRSKAKLALLTEKFGERGFVYAGNSAADYAVWRGSGGAIVVSDSECFRKRARQCAPVVEREFEAPGMSWGELARSLRCHQWIKNVLVFIPLLVGHQITNLFHIAEATIAFFALSVCASAVYLINDLCDLEADRAHRTKRARPLASGSLQISAALLLVPTLFALGFFLASALDSAAVQMTLLGYILLTSLYTFLLKSVTLVDVILLASFYTVRIFLGAAATGIPVSNWLFAFSAFFFFSLAAVKRVTELLKMPEGKVVAGRGYRRSDVGVLEMMGIASGFISVLVLALYCNGAEVRALYSRPDLLWGLCVIVFFWLGRVWIYAARGELNEDPVVFALFDRLSYFLGALALGIGVLAAV